MPKYLIPMENINFDFSTLFEVNENVQVEKKNIKTTVELSGSALANNISKSSKAADDRYNKKVNRSYACNYEKGLITISEKHNGEM